MKCMMKQKIIDINYVAILLQTPSPITPPPIKSASPPPKKTQTKIPSSHFKSYNMWYICISRGNLYCVASVCTVQSHIDLSHFLQQYYFFLLYFWRPLDYGDFHIEIYTRSGMWYRIQKQHCLYSNHFYYCKILQYLVLQNYEHSLRLG